MEALLSVNHISVNYGHEAVLKNLSFDINSGEILGIIGPNGAGKSTLLKTILGIVKPYKGEIILNEQIAVKPHTVIGYVPQSRPIDMGSTVHIKDFISMGLPHTFRPWLNKKERKILDEIMDITQTREYIHKSISKLSGGQRQRVFLAQALARQPKILLLDEPTSNLDPSAQEQIAIIVRRISRELDISAIFISHDLALIAQYADRILYLTKEKYDVGPVKEMMTPSVLSSIYGANINVRG